MLCKYECKLRAGGLCYLKFLSIAKDILAFSVSKQFFTFLFTGYDLWYQISSGKMLRYCSRYPTANGDYTSFIPFIIIAIIYIKSLYQCHRESVKQPDCEHGPIWRYFGWNHKFPIAVVKQSIVVHYSV